MFAAVQEIAVGYVICGLIWALVLGLAVGNYACSLVHRLPRKLPLLDKTPYCGNCGTLLQPRDLFPVASALLLKHRCRYCHAPFPKVHTVVELLSALFFMLLFMQVGFSEQFLLIAAVGIFWLVVVAMEWVENAVVPVMLVALAVASMMLRILLDGALFPMVEAALFALLPAALIARKHIQKIGHVYRLPSAVWLFVIAAMGVGRDHFVTFLAVTFLFWALTWALCRLKERPFTWSPALAVAVLWVLILPSPI